MFFVVWGISDWISNRLQSYNNEGILPIKNLISFTKETSVVQIESAKFINNMKSLSVTA